MRRDRLAFLVALFLIVAAVPLPAHSQSLTLDIGGPGSSSSAIIQMIAALSVLSLAPGILVMCTAFTRIVVILSLLRSALGLQQTPPTPVIISLALFLTAYVMAPTAQAVWDDAFKPLSEGIITEEVAFERTTDHVRAYMEVHVRESDLKVFLDMAKIELKEGEKTPMMALIPAFMISELYRAFQIGFILFLPFLVIDLAIAAVLMSMGMMMLPPVIVAMPFKIAFFVLIDGWALVVQSILRGF